MFCVKKLGFVWKLCEKLLEKWCQLFIIITTINWVFIHVLINFPCNFSRIFFINLLLNYFPESSLIFDQTLSDLVRFCWLFSSHLCYRRKWWMLRAHFPFLTQIGWRSHGNGRIFLKVSNFPKFYWKSFGLKMHHRSAVCLC